jgi:hypothetical protein
MRITRGLRTPQQRGRPHQPRRAREEITAEPSLARRVGVDCVPAERNPL